jgi:tetratricopeptide (TPR) repeat protein
MKRILFILTLFGLINTTYAQQKVVDSLKIVIKKSGEEDKAELLNKIAFESFLIGKPEDCISYAKNALEIAKKLNQAEQEAIAYKNVAIGKTFTGDEEQAFQFYQKAIDAFTKVSNYEQIARIYNNISHIYLSRGDLNKVHDFLFKAYELRKEHDIPDVALLSSLSNFYQLLGRYDKSLEYILGSIKLAEEKGDITGVAFGYTGLAYNYQVMNDFKMAKIYYQKGLNLFEQLEQKKQCAALYNNLGDIYVKEQKFDSAHLFLQKSLRIKEELNYDEGRIFSHITIGDYYTKTDTISKAITSYEKAISIAKQKNISHLLALAYNKIAMLYYQLKQQSEAKNYFSKSNKLADQNNSLDLLSSNHSYLYKIDSIEGNYKSAFFNLLQYKKSADSILDETKHKQIKELEFRYETEKKEQQISFLSKQNRNQKITNIIITIALVLSVLTMILLYSRFKMRRKILKAKKLQAEAELEEQKAIQRQQELESKLKLEEEQRKQEELKAQAELTILNNEKLQAELDHSHRELSSSTMYAYQKNEILGKIGEIISELAPENKETKEKVKELSRIVKNNLDDESEWERLKLHFEKVHPNFFTNLYEKYPALTHHELKHCAYLKIKLSNKEIAALLNVNPKSMQMARYRLKKKMNLGPDEDLLDLINQV